MILKLKLINVFSIGEVELDFNRARYAYKKDMILNDIVVNPLAIYGFNGSGKSSLFKSLASFISFFDYDNNYEFENNYLLEQKAKKENNNYPYLISKFIISFKLDNDLYDFEMQVCNKEIIKEELIKNNLKILERIGNKYLLYSYYNSYKETKVLNKSIILIEKENLKEVYDYFSHFSIILDDRTISIAYALKNKNIYDLFYKYQKEINDITSDILGAYNYEIIKDKYNYLLKYDDNYLPITKLSRGTFNLNLIITLILTSPKGNIIFIDDLDTNLHPFTLEKILNLSKEKQIQLVFSSHNTHFMQYLRPDQIYIVSFNGEESKFKRLSEFKENIREINNIEKMYLAYAFKA